MSTLEFKLLNSQCGSIFVAKNLHESIELRRYSKQNFVIEVLPKIFYKPYKRKKDLDPKKAFKISILYIQQSIHAFCIPKGKTAAYLFDYENMDDITEFDFYAPIIKNKEYKFGKYSLRIFRKDKNSFLYSLGKRATVIELFRYIGVNQFSHNTRVEVAKRIKKKDIAILLKCNYTSKWIKKELKKIKDIKGKMNEEKIYVKK